MCNLAWEEAGFNSRTTFGDVVVPLLGLHVLALHFAFACSPQKKNKQIFRLLLKISVEENNSNESLSQFFEALPVGGAYSSAEEVYDVFAPFS